jgi:hypothetical protein
VTPLLDIYFVYAFHDGNPIPAKLTFVHFNENLVIMPTRMILYHEEEIAHKFHFGGLDMYLGSIKRYIAIRLGGTSFYETEVAMDLHLKENEASLTFRILRNRLEELRTEVRHSKDSSTREYLKYKERILNNVLSKFSGVDEDAHKKDFFNG